MVKLLMMPPCTRSLHEWAKKIRQQLPIYNIVMPDTMQIVRTELATADAVFGWVAPDLLPIAKKLRWIQSPAAGPPAGFYYPELIDHPVQICNPRGVYNDHIGQHILMCILALARGLPSYIEAQRNKYWDQNARKTSYIDLKNATALIVGVGGIGQETARLCEAFGMRTLGVDIRWEYQVEKIEKYQPDSLDRLIPLADFVIVTVPHTPQTEGMWNLSRFKKMKPTAYFVNIGRGATTQIEDLTQAIENGHIAGAALDVYEVEPFSTDHRLWNLPNVILTPHIAVKDAVDVPSRQFELLLDNARRFAAGEPLRNLVNKAQWF